MYYTKEQLKTFLRSMGLRSGTNVFLEATGDFNDIIGKEKTILDAIKEIVGYEAVILVPSFTPNMVAFESRDIVIDFEELKNIEYNMEVFDIKKSMPDTKIATQLMLYDDVVRSNHPTHSMLLWGKYATTLASQHPLHFALAKNSPIDKLFGLKAVYLSFNHNTSYFDYVASMSSIGSIKINHVQVFDKNQRSEKTLLEFSFNKEQYTDIENTLLKEELAERKLLGNHSIMMMSMNKTFPLIQLLLGRKDADSRI